VFGVLDETHLRQQMTTTIIDHDFIDQRSREISWAYILCETGAPPGGAALFQFPDPGLLSAGQGSDSSDSMEMEFWLPEMMARVERCERVIFSFASSKEQASRIGWMDGVTIP